MKYKIFFLSLLCFFVVCAHREADVHPITGKRFGYDPYFQNISKKLGDTAVIVFGFNRAHYFKEVIAALEKNPESQTLPFFFILDGGSQSDQYGYRRIIKTSKIKKYAIISRPINYGLHFNLIAGLGFIFDWCGFEKIIHFEDDVVVTPEYLSLMFHLDEWAHANYGNIGAVQGFRPCRLDDETKKLKRKIVAETPGLWLGYCLRKNVWDDIKEILYEYERLFLGRSRLETSRIKEWMNAKLQKRSPHKNDKVMSWVSPHDSYYDKLPEMGVGQCGMLTMSLYVKGYVRLVTYVNRAITIGEIGANYKSEKYQHHHGGVTLNRFIQDSTLTAFEPLMQIVY